MNRENSTSKIPNISLISNIYVHPTAICNYQCKVECYEGFVPVITDCKKFVKLVCLKEYREFVNKISGANS